jgi:hypothetical protein
MMGRGRDAHLPSMINAAGTCLIATALRPCRSSRAARIAIRVTQAGLVATMLHLFAAVGPATA